LSTGQDDKNGAWCNVMAIPHGIESVVDEAAASITPRRMIRAEIRLLALAPKF
jgi:hypothetical protein